MAADLGIDVKIVLRSDSVAALGIGGRQARLGEAPALGDFLFVVAGYSGAKAVGCAEDQGRRESRGLGHKAFKVRRHREAPLHDRLLISIRSKSCCSKH